MNSFFASIMLMIVVISVNAQQVSSFKDSRDSKTYRSVKIGNQTWMARNLAYKSTDGCVTYDNNENNGTIYGYLYTWETANKVCPAGWHLPSNEEFGELISFLGGDTIAGRKLKEAGTAHWTSPNKAATNQTGFTGLPGGYIQADGSSQDIKQTGEWWSSTDCASVADPKEASFSWARSFSLINNPDYPDELNAYAYSNIHEKKASCSVRCINDVIAKNTVNTNASELSTTKTATKTETETGKTGVTKTSTKTTTSTTTITTGKKKK